jgi:hypothetical protein
VSRPPKPASPHPDPADAASGPSAVPHRPATVLVAAAVLALESLAVLAVALWYISELLTVTPVSLGGAIFMIVLLVGVAAGLGAVAVNLYRGFRWTRAAAFVWQLLMLAIAVPILLSGQPLPGLALLQPALLVAVLLFTPKLVFFTLRTRSGPPVL